MKSMTRLGVHGVLGALVGLVLYSAVTRVAHGRVKGPNLAEVDEADAAVFFAEEYRSASVADMENALQRNREEIEVRRNQAIESLVATGDYEVIVLDDGAPIHLGSSSISLSVRPLEGTNGLYEKVSIPRGLDPEFDLLVDECAWLEDELDNQDRTVRNR